MMTAFDQPLRKDLIFTWMKNLEVDTGIDFLEDMVHRFEIHYMETILEMKNDFKNRDQAGIAFKAHKLKSAAGNLGASGAWDLCTEIETNCQKPEWDKIKSLIALLATECMLSYLDCKVYITASRARLFTDQETSSFR
ncbi:MAG: Hpt domain-containing protein [Pseudobdellovibrionaceae bacterium]